MPNIGTRSGNACEPLEWLEQYDSAGIGTCPGNLFCEFTFKKNFSSRN